MRVCVDDVVVCRRGLCEFARAGQGQIVFRAENSGKKIMVVEEEEIKLDFVRSFSSA